MQGWPGLDYMLQATIKPSPPLPNSYIKDISYGGISVFHRWLRIGTAIGDARLRITLANDGGVLKVSAADSSGKIGGNARVLILPATATSESILADSMITAQAGPSGDFASPALPPGKYYVLATYDLIDKTPEALTAVWRARLLGKEVDINPGATASVTVEPRTLFERR